MSDFSGMEELLQDFLTEASELLSDVDNKLVELEKKPNDKALLNDIFRGFHTIKGGAGFLNVTELINLCHRTENLFDKLRNGELPLNSRLMDVILDATAVVRQMFGSLSKAVMPQAADAALIADLDAALAGKLQPTKSLEPKVEPAVDLPSKTTSAKPGTEPDWDTLYHALLGTGPGKPSTSTRVETPAIEIKVTDKKIEVARPPEPPRPTQPTATPSAPPTPSLPSAAAIKAAVEAIEPLDKKRPTAAKPPAAQQIIEKETTIRIDTNRLDQVLNLSGEIGLTKNRLTTLRAEILSGKTDQGTFRALDEAVSQLDLLVSDLQNAVMKTRMQPIGRLFQKYPRLARDLARQLGKDVELVIAGEETEIDKTMLEDLNDPLVHLVRNAVDHGVETSEERIGSGKAAKSLIQLSANQIGDHILIEITDDGRGMRPDIIRHKAVQKGLIDLETANSLDDRQSLQLIFLPGFSTKDEISNVSGRGVGMDVVKTNIQKLNGRIDIHSVPGEGTRISISLPLTLAILPVLVVRLGDQPFAVPLGMVREIIPINSKEVQEVSGRATLVVRDEILPIRSLASLINWPITERPGYGVLMQSAETAFILAVDGFVGRDDVVIKPLQNIKPRGVAGATLSGDGSIVLVLDMEELLSSCTVETRADLFALELTH